MREEAARTRISVADGVALSVVERGVAVADRPPSIATDREPFLLVHGLASNARMWDGVGERLLAAGHPSVAVDQRGHGLSDAPDTGYDFATLVDDLVRVLDATGLERPIAVGQSWGGNVVLELACRRPDLVRGVVGVDGGTIELGRAFPDWEDAARELAPPDLLGTPRAQMERRIREAHPDWPETGIMGAMANFRVLDDGTIAPWLTRGRHMTILGELWRHRPSELFAALPVPVLLLLADGRGRDPVRAATHRASVERTIATSDAARVIWFVDADHDLHAQMPERCVATMLDALHGGWFGP